MNTAVRIPTGSDLLDLLVGGGEGLGYPGGRIINLVGDKSSGKTFLACEIIAAARWLFKNKLRWIYDDGESGFSFNTKKLWGFEIMPINRDERTKSATVEDLYCNVRKFAEGLKDREFGIYCVDSLDGVGSKQMDQIADDQYKSFLGTKKEKLKGSYKMGKANYLSQTLFPKLADLLETKNILFIVISQVRVNLDPFSFEKFSRSGGKALDFYCHTVLWAANIMKLKKKDRPVGVTIKVKNNKSKTPRPYREAFLTIYFDYGLDNISTNLDFLFDFRTKSGMIEADARAAWDMEGEVSIEQIKEFLQETKKEAFYRKNIAAKIKRSEFIDWLYTDKNKALLKKYQAKFLKKMTRTDLITFIEENNLQKELTRRVVEKWEQIEESIASHRPAKYQ